MSCIILVGGLIGCGKSELVNFIVRNKETLFNETSIGKTIGVLNNSSKNISCSENEITFRIFTISFDELCSIEDQAELMKTFKGLKLFRSDFLDASESFICSVCKNQSELENQLSKRGDRLLKMLKTQSPDVDSKHNLFLVEDNFYYRSMRYEWLQLARRVNLGYCQIFVTCPLEVAIQRNRSRNYNIPDDRVKRIHSYLEYPDSMKYKWEKYSITFDSSEELQCNAMKELVNMIEKACNNPAEVMLNEEKKKAQAICSKNIMHQTDRIIRKLTSKKISTIKGNMNPKSDIKEMVSIILSARQKLLFNIKQNSVLLPTHLIESIENLGICSVEQEFENVLETLFDEVLLSLGIKELL